MISYGKNLRSWPGFATALVLVAAAAVVRAVALGALGTRVPFVTFYPVVVIAALCGGLWEGLLATALSAVAATWWIEPGGRLLVIQHSADWLSMGMFLANGAIISGLCHTVRGVWIRDGQAQIREQEIAQR